MQIHLCVVLSVSAFLDGEDMKCPKCGKGRNEIIIIASNIYICPLCGTTCDSDGKCKEHLESVLKLIVEDYGMDILADVGRVNALLMDYAPNLDKERKLLVSVLKEGIQNRLKLCLEYGMEDKQLEIKRCEQRLVRDLWIVEEAAKYAVRVISIAIGLIETSELTEEEIEKDIVLDKENADSVQRQIVLLNRYNVIGYKAFACNITLTHLSIPENIQKIKSKAFLNCINLKEIIIPSSVEIIAQSVFEGCISLHKIICEENKHYTVVRGMLIDKKNKSLMRFCNDDAVEECKIAEGIETICKKAFDRNKVKYVYVPKTVNNFEVKAFYLTMLFEEYRVDIKNREYSSIEGVLHTKKRDILLHYPQGRKVVNYIVEESVSVIGDYGFSCARNLETITFTTSLKTIGNFAFEYCEKLESIIFPNSVISIGDRAFQYCERMKSVMLPRSITEIGDYAFYCCISITTVSVPKNVKRIGHMAFANCKSLLRVVMQENIEFIGDGAFIGCSNVEIVIKSNTYVETYCKSHGISFSLM